MAENKRPIPSLEDLLGPISPLSAPRPSNSDASSFSFNKGGGDPTPLAGDAALSNESRPPLGRLQTTSTFEFAANTNNKPAPRPFSNALKPRLAATTQTAPKASTAAVPPKAPKAAAPFEATTTLPTTPLPVLAASQDDGLVTPPPRGRAAAAAAARADTVASWGAVLRWERPFASAFWFITGLLGLAAGTWALYGDHRITPLSGAACVLLLDLGWNFCRFFLSRRWQEASTWVGSSWTAWATRRASDAIASAAAAHDAYLSAVDPFVTLRAAATLWALAVLGAMFPPWHLVVAAYFAAFTLPPLYAACKRRADAFGAALHRATLARLDALEMPRTTRVATALLGVAALLAFAGVRQALIGAFVALTYFRTTLVPQEVEAIRAAAEPYTQSVRKARRAVSLAIDEAVVRYSGAPRTRTKSHFRKQQ